MREAGKKTEILILGNYPPPFGGVPRLIEGMVPYLIARGYEITIVSGGSEQVIQSEGLKVLRIGTKSKGKSIARSIFPFLRFLIQFGFSYPYGLKHLFRSIVLSKYLEKEIDQHSFKLICSYNIFLFGILGHFLSVRHGIPHVMVNFGEILSEGQTLQDNPKLLKFIDAQVKNAVNRVAISHHCAESYTKLHLQKAEVIASCIDVAHFKPAVNQPDIRQQWRLKPEAFILGYLGRFSDQLGIHMVIEVVPEILERYQHVIFILGGARGEFDLQAEELTKRYQDRVFIFHDIPFSQLNEFYQCMDILLSPSINERACGTLSSMEAMSCEVPVIGSDMGGIPEVVIPDVSGYLFEPNNVIDFKEKIEWVIEHPIDIKQLGKSARELMKKEYPIDKYNRQFDELFRKILSA